MKKKNVFDELAPSTDRNVSDFCATSFIEYVQLIFRSQHVVSELLRGIGMSSLRLSISFWRTVF